MSITSDPVWQARETRPTDPDHLWDWVATYTGIRVPREPVCPGHSAPFDFFCKQVLERPPLSLWHGPRGSGKSFLSAIDTHITSRFHPRMGTRILGGSLAQSGQVYEAIDAGVRQSSGPEGYSDADAIASLQKQTCRYENGSEVAILAASSTSVRGPHVPCLKLDEVDEIDDDLRQQAMGIPMERFGYHSSTLMTSTYHKVGGPMSRLIDEGLSGKFPVYSYCIFEVLERCPDERSGPKLELCPECPIVKWCHAGRDEHPSRLPKAKRSDGHYRIQDLITKTAAVSGRVFESDYLSHKPRAAGVWFTMFDEAIHVAMAAEFNPSLPVHLAIDPGVHCGAVWFQVRRRPDGGMAANVFADYYYEATQSDSAPAEKNARAILEVHRQRCGVPMSQVRVSMDTSGSARTGAGPIVRGEFERVGCKGRQGIEGWVKNPGSVADSLQLVEALLKAADGSVNLRIHPRCRHLIQAFGSYVRKKRGGSWQDEPADEQHPAEDLIDPLRCGLKLEAPEGRTPPPALWQVPSRRLF